MKKTPVGILGGTFDPPHRAHLALAQAAIGSGNVERVRLFPARIPPHKFRSDMSSPQERMEMARLLCLEDPRIDVDGAELGRDGPSYTVDTIRDLIRRQPGIAPRIIIGSDLVSTFHEWREAEELVDLAPPLVAARPGYPLLAEPVPGMSDRLAKALRDGVFPMPETALSSTMIRQAVGAGAGNRELLAMLTPDVLAYVRKNSLYALPD